MSTEDKIIAAKQVLFALQRGETGPIASMVLNSGIEPRHVGDHVVFSWGPMWVKIGDATALYREADALSILDRKHFIEDAPVGAMLVTADAGHQVSPEFMADNIEYFLNTLTGYHEITCDDDYMFGVNDLLSELQDRIDPDMDADLLQHCQQLLSSLTDVPESDEIGLCHIDPRPENWAFSVDSLSLVDWEHHLSAPLEVALAAMVVHLCLEEQFEAAKKVIDWCDDVSWYGWGVALCSLRLILDTDEDAWQMIDVLNHRLAMLTQFLGATE